MTDEQIKAVINQISGLAGLDPHYRFAVNMAREVLALRDALAAVCDELVVEAFEDGPTYCLSCHLVVSDDGVQRHAPDCPVADALALLEGGA